MGALFNIYLSRVRSEQCLDMCCPSIQEQDGSCKHRIPCSSHDLSNRHVTMYEPGSSFWDVLTPIHMHWLETLRLRNEGAQPPTLRWIYTQVDETHLHLHLHPAAEQAVACGLLHIHDTLLTQCAHLQQCRFCLSRRQQTCRTQNTHSSACDYSHGDVGH